MPQLCFTQGALYGQAAFVFAFFGVQLALCSIECVLNVCCCCDGLADRYSIRFGDECAISSNHGNTKQQRSGKMRIEDAESRCLWQHSVSSLGLVSLLANWAFGIAKAGCNTDGARDWFEALVTVGMTDRTGHVQVYLVHKWERLVFQQVCVCVSVCMCLCELVCACVCACACVCMSRSHCGQDHNPMQWPVSPS